jgi:hypothetical protein
MPFGQRQVVIKSSNTSEFEMRVDCIPTMAVLYSLGSTRSTCARNNLPWLFHLLYNSGRGIFVPRKRWIAFGLVSKAGL